ncbi:MAG: methionine synthase [Muribaculaceae bacterium]|nr:methionine synthase [Muribaculaceae bacterium]
MEELKTRVLVLDGAMGTMIQRHALSEEDFRGEEFRGLPGVLKGCNDLLTLTRPDIILGIHDAYLEAGADIIETNTFNANAISLREYGLEDMVERINREGARLARESAARHEARTGRRAYVAGSVGPSNVALSMPRTPGEAAVCDFATMAASYEEQCLALMRGGVDLILLETIFDTLNAKAAIYGLWSARERISAEGGTAVPVMVSVTLTQTGRTLSGQTIRAFLASVAHVEPLSVGLNCGFGAEQMESWLEEMQDAPYYISIHPNAGLPDEMGNYSETPERMASVLGKYLDRGWLNIVGGCCGTTPAHIATIASVARDAVPRVVPQRVPRLLLAGLEPLDASLQGFLKVGERCNVAGSRRFLRLVNEGDTAGALKTAADQVEKGAVMLDVNMDDGMLDTSAEMERFVTLLGLDAATAPVSLMIDSSDFGVIRRALTRVQGRPVVNSISLKEGEEVFLSHARELKALGAAVVVMAFDEKGQADTLERRIEICGRAYRLLTQEGGMRGEDIIFDPNILTVATGMREHDRYALDFLEATQWIKENLPGASVSGGVSNLSFAFRGNNRVREAMHTVFLHHAMQRGMDMAIINPATSLDISTVEPQLREAVEDVLLCRRPDATERLTAMAADMAAKAAAEKGRGAVKSGAVTKSCGPGMTLADMVVAGVSDSLEKMLDEALEKEGSAMGVVRNCLMEGMNRVGEAFGAGRMFLPQVVRSAGVMKQAIGWLTPHIEREAGGNTAGGGAGGKGKKIILATVKGDVHDIGKNIVAVVLRCSGFDVTDLGVMVPASEIVDAVKREGASFVGLSGLITPSLSEMCEVARALEREGLADVVLCVGGATTSALHTAVKIAPEFSGTVVHTRDAATLPDVASRLASPATSAALVEANRKEQQRLREEYAESKRLKENSRESGPADKIFSKSEHPSAAPQVQGLSVFDVPVAEVAPLINWKAYLGIWRLPKEGEGLEEEKEQLLADGHEALERIEATGFRMRCAVALLPARRDGLDIAVTAPDGELRIPTMRQESGQRISAADFLAEKDDWIGLFYVTVGQAFEKMLSSEEDDYRRLVMQGVGDRLAEAATEWLHEKVHNELWRPGTAERGPRPAIGYPSLPDQTLTHLLDSVLHYGESGVSLTENGALYPSATTTGLIFASPRARYFDLGPVSDAALADYARRRGLSPDRVRALLPRS